MLRSREFNEVALNKFLSICTLCGRCVDLRVARNLVDTRSYSNIHEISTLGQNRFTKRCFDNVQLSKVAVFICEQSSCGPYLGVITQKIIGVHGSNYDIITNIFIKNYENRFRGLGWAAI